MSPGAQATIGPPSAGFLRQAASALGSRDVAPRSFGASLAALLGSTLYAAVISWRMRRTLPYSLSTAAWTGALALVVVPLAWLKGGWGTNALLLLVASTGYLLCLFRLRIVTFAEIAMVGQLLRPSERVAA